MWHIWGRGVVYAGFWWENLRAIDHLEDLGVGGRIIVKGIRLGGCEQAWFDT